MAKYAPLLSLSKAQKIPASPWGVVEGVLSLGNRGTPCCPVHQPSPSLPTSLQHLIFDIVGQDCFLKGFPPSPVSFFIDTTLFLPCFVPSVVICFVSITRSSFLLKKLTRFFLSFPSFTHFLHNYTARS